MSWFNDNLPEDLAKSIIRVDLKFNDKAVSHDFKPDVSIDYDDLEKQLEDSPSQFAFWAVVASEQKAKVAYLERQLIMAKSKAERLIQDELRRHDAKLGVREINAAIEMTDQVHKIACQIIEENKKYFKLKSIVDAMKMKSEHLRSLAGFKREEQRNS